ncbi:methionine ABC transporter permease [Lactococcus fujiensis]|nr:methionine ABC transporter permease [Lactococcus fujiensis]
MIAWFNHTFPNVVYLGWGGDTGWGTAISQTLYMTFFSALIGGLIGLIFGIGVVVTAEDGIAPNRILFWIFDKIISIGRAIPFIILLAVLAPLSKLLVGTQIGTTAALIPLSLGVAPFYARQVQASLESVDYGKIEAAQTVGADFIDIVFTVYLREELANLIRVTTVTIISLIGLTAMAGAVGAGGLGNTAISYGYNRFFNDVTWMATLLILIFVLLVQFIGDFLAKKVSHR